MVGRAKKKLSDQLAADGYVVDPLEGMQIHVENYDVKRIASVYPDRSGNRWWTKAYFNGREKGEQSIEINKKLAEKFINNEVTRDDWLKSFYPKQMSVCQNSIQKTREQLLGI